MLKIEAVKVRRLYMEIANQIERLIRSGDIQAGERLPSERDLAASFKVSRPTIREAMIALEVAGLVEIRTGSGIYALQPGGVPDRGVRDEGPGPFEIFESRLLIEAETAALAARHISDEQLAELEATLREMEKESVEGSVTERADQRFHCIIAEASENSALASMVAWLWEMRNRSEVSTLFHQRVSERGVHPDLDDHIRVFEAVRRRDPAGARKAMRQHITHALANAAAHLEQDRPPGQRRVARKR